MSSSASSARYRLSATTTATPSPTYRTFSAARQRQVWRAGSGPKSGIGSHSSAASAPVITACTPGAASACGGLDPQDPGVRVRAAQHGGVQGAGGDPVGDVTAPAEQELRVFDPADGLAHPAPLGGVVTDRGSGGGPVDGGHEATSSVARIRAAAPITASVMNW